MGRKFMKVDGTPQKMSPIAMLKKLSKMKKLSKLLETKYKGYDVNGHRGISEDAMKVLPLSRNETRSY